MKKLAKLLMAFLASVLCFGTAVACDETPEHNFADTLSHDDAYHWYACTDEGCSEVKDKEEHALTETVITASTYTAKGKAKKSCTCGYETAEYELAMLVQETPAYTVPTLEELTVVWREGLTLADIELPAGFAWEDLPVDPEEVPLDVAKYENATCSYTVPGDTQSKYKVVTGISVVFEVVKAEPSVPTINAANATYGQTLAQVTAPTVQGGTLVWKNANALVGNAGNRTHVATFVPTDDDHYNTVDVEITVVVGALAVTSVTIDDIATYTATGSEITPDLVVKADGVEIDAAEYEVAYEDNVYPGTATVTVTLTGNYTGSVEAEKSFTIIHKTVTGANDWTKNSAQGTMDVAADGTSMVYDVNNGGGTSIVLNGAYVPAGDFVMSAILKPNRPNPYNQGTNGAGFIITTDQQTYEILLRHNKRDNETFYNVQGYASFDHENYGSFGRFTNKGTTHELQGIELTYESVGLELKVISYNGMLHFTYNGGAPFKSIALNGTITSIGFRNWFADVSISDISLEGYDTAPVYTYAGTVKGYEAGGNANVANATVKVAPKELPANDAYTYTTTADANGAFSLSVPAGTVTVTVTDGSNRYVGKTFTVDASGNLSGQEILLDSNIVSVLGNKVSRADNGTTLVLNGGASWEDSMSRINPAYIPSGNFMLSTRIKWDGNYYGEFYGGMGFIVATTNGSETMFSQILLRAGGENNGFQLFRYKGDAGKTWYGYNTVAEVCTSYTDQNGTVQAAEPYNKALSNTISKDSMTAGVELSIARLGKQFAIYVDGAMVHSFERVGSIAYIATYNWVHLGRYQNITITDDVEKLQPAYTLPSGITATYGDTLSQVQLPTANNGVWTWKEPTTSVGAVGEREFKAVFTPTDTNSYKTVEVTVTVEVEPKNLTDIATIEAIANQVYTGSQITPANIVVKDGTITLTVGTDYTVVYGENVNVTTGGSVTVTFKGNYSGTATKTFTITAKNLSSVATIDPISAVTYTGNEFTPTVVVKDGNKTLTLTTDYTVEYANNTGAGEATVTVTFTGNYAGAKSATFIIEKATPSYKAPNGLEAVVGQNVGSVNLPDSWTWNSPDDLVGTAGMQKHYATFTPADQDNYKAVSVELTISVLSNDMAAITIDAIADQTYTGSAITPDVVVKNGETTLVRGTDYEVAYTDNENAGEATITVTFKGYYSGIKTVTFNITAKALANATIEAIAEQEYNRNGNTPAVVVKDGNKTLTLTTDYTVAYANNTGVGEATVTVTFTGNYSGTKTATFNITAKVLANATIDAIADQTYTGSAITPAVVVKDDNDVLTLTTDYTVDITNNTAVGEATVTVTFTGNYSGTVTKKFNIVKADPVVEVEELEATYGDTLGQIELPSVDGGTLTWKDGADTLVGDVGNPKHVAVFTPDNANYNTVDVEITVAVAAKNVTELTLDDIATQTATGNALTPALVVKADGVALDASEYEVVWTNNVYPGTATVTVTLTGNYTGDTEVGTEFTITHKTVTGASDWTKNSAQGTMDVAADGTSIEYDVNNGGGTSIVLNGAYVPAGDFVMSAILKPNRPNPYNQGTNGAGFVITTDQQTYEILLRHNKRDNETFYNVQGYASFDHENYGSFGRFTNKGTTHELQGIELTYESVGLELKVKLLDGTLHFSYNGGAPFKSIALNGTITSIGFRNWFADVTISNISLEPTSNLITSANEWTKNSAQDTMDVAADGSSIVYNVNNGGETSIVLNSEHIPSGNFVLSANMKVNVPNPYGKNECGAGFVIITSTKTYELLLRRNQRDNETFYNVQGYAGFDNATFGRFEPNKEKTHESSGIEVTYETVGLEFKVELSNGTLHFSYNGGAPFKSIALDGTITSIGFRNWFADVTISNINLVSIN